MVSIYKHTHECHRKGEEFRVVWEINDGVTFVHRPFCAEAMAELEFMRVEEVVEHW